ncbi:MAG: aldo/keto reductase [Pseudomonadota bacterium]
MNIYFRNNFERAFGTFPLKGEELALALRTAAEAGYRAIDTAQLYDNEADVGAALRHCGVPRSELCITAKVHPDNFTEDKFIGSVEDSLKKLQIEQADVLLLHWAPIDGGIATSLRLLAQAARRGLTRHIGVSNYTAAMMREARQLIDTPIVTNQVEFHPLLDQSVLLQAATETGIPLSSYCSVARGEVFKYPLFGEIAQAYGKSAGQVVLRWILQKGVPINTMSTKPGNIADNFNVMDFTLSSIDMARIDALGRSNFRVVTSAKVPWAPAWD